MKYRCFWALLTGLLPGVLLAQNLSEAQQLAETGHFFKAEKIYNQALIQNPNDLTALIGAGYNYSWAGQYEQASQKFEAALAIDPANQSALLGQGYNLAWSHQYAAAKAPFLAIARKYPPHVEARKGLGYVYLWQGNSRVAIDYFQKLTQDYPNVSEYYIALAQAYLLENNVKRAQTALRTVLQIDKTNAIANQLLQNTYSLSAPVELDIWTGYSKTGEIGSFNLRTVQLSAQVAPKWRMFAKYDNSLTLDLASLVRTNQTAQAFALGAITPVSHQWTSRLEYGVRLLPSNITQHIFSTEQVWFLPGRYSLKGGGFFGAGQQVNREWLTYVSMRIPVTSVFSLEPYYFYSKVQDAPKAENRWMLNGQLKNPRGFEVNLGALYGKAGVSYEVVDNDIFGAYITGLAPFSKFVWGMASVRYEKAPFDTRLTAMTLGIKIRV